jgi:hypothetical protein
MICIQSDEEASDLIAWLDHHPQPEDFDGPNVEELYGEATREAAQAWLQMMRDTGEGPDSYPIHAPIPLRLIPVIDAVIDDWAEVLGSHNEETYTHTVHAAEAEP